MVGVGGVGELQWKHQEALEMSWRLGRLGSFAKSTLGPGREGGGGRPCSRGVWSCLILENSAQLRSPAA